jgi:AraC family transcriptional regulator
MLMGHRELNVRALEQRANTPSFGNHSSFAIEAELQRAGKIAASNREPHCEHRGTAAVQRVVSSIAGRLDHALGNEALARIACLSPYYFSRVFRSVTGVPPIQFLYAMRLQRAKELLIYTEQNITDVCLEVGYASLGTFTSRFKAVVGTTPTQFRRLSREMEGMLLSDLRSIFRAPNDAPAHAGVVTGTIKVPQLFEGVVFVGLYRSAIPEGEPLACSIASPNNTFAIPTSRARSGYLMAVAVPWTARGASLFTLQGFARAKTGLLTFDNNSGRPASCELDLRSAQSSDPPILTAMPVLITRQFASGMPMVPRFAFERADPPHKVPDLFATG